MALAHQQRIVLFFIPLKLFFSHLSRGKGLKTAYHGIGFKQFGVSPFSNHIQLQARAFPREISLKQSSKCQLIVLCPSVVTSVTESVSFYNCCV